MNQAVLEEQPDQITGDPNEILTVQQAAACEFDAATFPS
jgi:hypothetical protein